MVIGLWDRKHRGHGDEPQGQCLFFGTRQGKGQVSL